MLRVGAQVARHTARRALSGGPAAGAAGGKLLIWGTNEDRKLGFDDAEDRELPAELPDFREVSALSVSCGKRHTAALCADGRVLTWGSNAYGQLGHGAASPKGKGPEAVAFEEGTKIAQVSCGEFHTAAVTEDGRVLTWGYGGSFFAGPGGLGLSTGGTVLKPTPVKGFGPGEAEQAVAVSAGAYHTIARTLAGSVYSWGRGEWGRLGHGSSTSYDEPLRVEQLVDVGCVDCIAREFHSVSLDTSGRVYTWGRNEHWQLGYEVGGFLNSGSAFDAQLEPMLVPLVPEGAAADAEPVGGGREGVLIGASDHGTAFVLRDRKTVLVWGFNKFFEPTPLPGTDRLDGPVVGVACGDSHLLLLTEGGGVYTWGAGAPVGVPQGERKQYTLARNEALAAMPGRVLAVACGPSTSAAIVER